MVNKLKTVIFLFFILSISVHSQTDTSDCCPEGFTGDLILSPNVVFEDLIVEDSLKYSSKPIIVDSISSILKRLNESWPNIHIGLEGRLVVSIKIDSKGLIDGIELIRGIEDKLDSTALDIVESIKFKPAKIGIDNVPSEVVLILNYRIIAKRDEPSAIVSEIMLDYKPGMIYEYWKIVYKSDFTAYYEKVYPDSTQRFSGKIDEHYFNRLNDLIHSICFFKMQDSYGSQYTDAGTVTLTVSQGDVTKSIRLYRNLPIGLWSLQQLIYYLRDDFIEWNPSK